MVARVLTLREEHDELVAAVPAEQITTPHSALRS